MPEISLADNERFWVILLGKRYERIPESKRDLERLCSEFYVGRKNIIRSDYSTKEDFIEKIQGLDEDEAKQELLTIWAKKKWEEKSKGKDLELDGDFSEELGRLREGGKVIQELDEDYYLIWPSQSHARVLTGDDDIYGQLQDEAHPIIVKKEGDNIEVRGGKRRVTRFSEEFSESEEVQEVEPEQSNESIIDDLSMLFEKELDTLKLTEIRFLRTYLPDNSSVGLKNDKGILRDLNDENVRQEIVDYQSLSELDFLGVFRR